ncbi:hypothetical protein LZ30DRAFT_701767 [Colletotrichum cereale]|nr:hypothetical protein LZ30DRAFT_701767 [Colletotrichum cereale]
MSNNTGSNGSLGNSSNPRPGQSPFPPFNALVRKTTQGSQQSEAQQSQAYTSSYRNNFNRDTARYSTGRTDQSSRYSQENTDPPNRSQSPSFRRKQGENDPRKNWEESIYGMYGDIKTPREPPPPTPPPPTPPPPRQEQRRRRYQQPEDDEGNDLFDEEVPPRTNSPSEPQRPRYSRPRQDFRPERPEPRRRASLRDRQQNEQQGEENDDGNYRRVHVNIDIGGGEGRSWSWRTDRRGGPNVNFGTPGFPFGGRNNSGRLPLNGSFGGGLPINLPFGL